MGQQRKLYLAALCVLSFIAAQAFQQIAYWLWIPATHGAQDDLQTYLRMADEVRALLIGGTILMLLVPFTVIALRFFKAAPLSSTLGLVFGAAFLGCETVYRSLDFFVIGMKWAHDFQNASGVERELILHRFALWNELVRGWYFPLMLAYFLASCCFLVATWAGRGKGGWHLLAPIAFALNALRLLARLLSTFAGQTWLEGFNGALYFPAVLVVNGLLAAWFFYLAALPDEWA